MSNPWYALPPGEVVLPADKPYIDAFNKRRPGIAERFHEINPIYGFPLLPEPFLGNVCAAPVVVLQLNPRVQATEEPMESKSQKPNRGKEPEAAPEAHQFDNPEMRAYLRDPCRSQCHTTVLKNKWWAAVTRMLCQKCETLGVAREQFERSICSIEFIPYWSQTFASDAGKIRLPSQIFAFSLVRYAIARRAVFVLLRGQSEWYGAVPELAAARVIRRRDRLGQIKPRLTEGQFANGSADLTSLVRTIRAYAG